MTRNGFRHRCRDRRHDCGIALGRWFAIVSFAAAISIPGASSADPLNLLSTKRSPEVRKQLSEVGADTAVIARRQGFTLGSASGEAPARSKISADRIRGAAAERASDATEGSWIGLNMNALSGHSAIYDPVRDRMLVFGGSGILAYTNAVMALSLTGVPTWTPLSPGGTLPTGRVQTCAVYDPVRDRLVIFGGSGRSALLNDVWALNLSGTPVWSNLSPAGAHPSARSGHSAIYDPVRDRIVVFGGSDQAGNRNDTWALSLSGTPTWTQLTPLGAAPSARAFHSAVYDPIHDRMLVFGGSTPLAVSNDLLSLSLSGATAWTTLTPIGGSPSARFGHGAIYDPAYNRMVIFGGLSASGYQSDVWTLSVADSDAWSPLTVSGPTPDGRTYSSVIYDPVRMRMVMFGGDSGGPRSDAWALTAGAPSYWTQLIPGGTLPGARDGQSAIYDPVRDRMVIFGGDTGASYANDLWALSLSGVPSWSRLSPVGPLPAGRCFHSAIYDPVRDRMIVFGGRNGNLLRDVWALSFSDTLRWTQLSPTGMIPLGRWGHAAIYDPLRDRMVMFAGASSPGADNDAWALSLAGIPAWSFLTPTGAPPEVRYGVSAIYDPIRDRMVTFGGYTYSGNGNDTWALSLSATPAWTALTPAGPLPAVRYGYDEVYDPKRDRIVIFGGSGALLYNDVWALPLAEAQAWIPLAPGGPPPEARYGPSAIYDVLRDRIVMFAGYVGNDTRRYDLWELSTGGVLGVGDPPARALTSHLRAPWPNPCREITSVSYSLALPGPVRLGIYDPQGRLVRRLVNGAKPAGTQTVTWDGLDESGSRLGTGLYFVRLTAPAVHETRRVILLN